MTDSVAPDAIPICRSVPAEVGQAVPVTKRRGQPKPSATGRLIWSSTGYRLLDQQGIELQPADGELTREDVQARLSDPSVRVVVYAGASALRWYSGDDSGRVWKDEIAPNFHDTPGWRPPPSARGQRPFHALRWTYPGRRADVLMFTDYD